MPNNYIVEEEVIEYNRHLNIPESSYYPNIHPYYDPNIYNPQQYYDYSYYDYEYRPEYREDGETK